MKLNCKILSNLIFSVIITVILVFVLQGCSENKPLSLVDGGIIAPVAEQPESYLPEAYSDNKHFDVFSYDTTAESLLELDIELEEEEIESKFQNEKLSALSEHLYNYNKNSDFVRADEPVNQGLNSSLSNYAAEDFYSGAASCVEASYLVNDVSNGRFRNTPASLQDLMFDLNSIVGCDDLLDMTNIYYRFESTNGLKSIVDKTEKVSEAEDYPELQGSDFGVRADNATNITVAETELNNTEILDSSNNSVPVKKEAISGVDNTAMLAQAQKYDEVVISLHEYKEKKKSVSFTEKSNSTKNIKENKNIIRLTLAEAIRMSLSGNQNVAAASYVSKQAEEKLNASKTVYDPVLYQNLSAESKEDLDADYYYLVQNPILSTNGWSVEGGLKQPLPTGGNISLAYEYAETMQDGVGKEVFRGVGGAGCNYQPVASQGAWRC